MPKISLHILGSIFDKIRYTKYMRFWKKLLFVFLLPFTLYLLPGSTYAADEFSVDASVTYDIQQTGKTVVSHAITLENNLSDIYATTYTLSLENIDVANVIARSDTGTNFPAEVSKEANTTHIKINFPDASVGKGVQRRFTVSYENSSFAVRTGEVWEVSVPRLGQDNTFRNYELILKVPVSLGYEAYISPQASSQETSDGYYIYKFNKSSLLTTGISAGFGQFQVFSFNLSYHLENPLSRNSTTDIALPPDTAFQKIYIQKIEPTPANVSVDSDGNWIATFNLSSRERIDVNVAGSVQIFASYRTFPAPSNEVLDSNLKETEYWQTSNPQIQKLAEQLKTPQAIYSYVAKTLKYDSERVQQNVQRMGASEALANPNNAICMEFTDLFIALARAAGIPAREVNGYAYTENSDIQPLGLVADVLHAWPEYYDKEKKVWMPIDPTWGSTSGVDYFNKLDLRHFVFVIHGASAKEPYPPGSYKLGPNPQKDVYVSFGQLPDNRIGTPQVSIEPFRILPFFNSIYTATISNHGPAALYSLYPSIYYDNVEESRDYIEVLPPFAKKQIQITLKHSILGKGMPNIIKIVAGSSTAEILTNKKQIIINSLIVISILFLFLTLFILIKAKKIKLLNFFAKIFSARKKQTNDSNNSQTPKNTSSV